LRSVVCAIWLIAASTFPMAITLGLMIQPHVLSTIAARQDFRGRGLLARFLYACLVSKLGHRTIGTPVSATVEAPTTIW